MDTNRGNSQKPKFSLWKVGCALGLVFLVSAALLLAVYFPRANTDAWERQMTRITWVAYSPPTSNPDQELEASLDDIRADLSILRQAGFTGLVSYGSTGVMGHDLPRLAQEAGFEGLIMGVWDPFDADEMAAAEAAAPLPIVLGFCVGNEGLGIRYSLAELSAAIEQLRETTGKPVTTTEQIEDYADPQLLALGDWVFPNVHPYFHNQLQPLPAVQWTKNAYDDFLRRTDRYVLFKEVGLPTAPDTGLSEENQKTYYLELAQTNVQFVYFEAFDQPWKITLPVEPHWGLFYADRTPKLLGASLLVVEPSTTAARITPQTPSISPAPSEPRTSEPVSSPPEDAFTIYQDIDSAGNHFTPVGFMGDLGSIQVNEAFEENPHSGKTSIRIIYDAQGNGPHECSYAPPCGWAGVYWQEPPNNWGLDSFWEGAGFDLSPYTRLVFWARADGNGVIEFKVGGIVGPYGDSLTFPRSILANLSPTWQEYEIELTGADLSHIIGGFVWATNRQQNPNGLTFYLDDIRFER